jgi:glycosyltransferase involved in cell wall biosynthesis
MIVVGNTLMTDKKIKILICTHSAALHSGLSETTRHIFMPLLQKYPEKYDVHQLGYFHFKASEQVPWPIYATKMRDTPQGPQPDMNDRYGQLSFNEVVAKIKPDIVFGYGDMWHYEHMLASPIRNSYRMLCYYTIDGQPYFGHLDKDNNTDWGKKLQKSDELVVLSHFGKETLKRGNKELKDRDIKVMYHPLDMGRYPVLNEEQRRTVRDKILPKHISRSAFICGWLGKNQFRKQNYKLWETLHYIVHGDYIHCNNCNRETLKEYNHTARRTKDPDLYPGELDKITMYDRDYRYEECWHCKSKDITNGIPNPNFYIWFHMAKDDPGYNPDLHENMWNVKENCIYTKDISGLSGVKPKDLAMLLASWDCMYYPSGGEGFGNPPYEALAAGTPVVYSDYSSHAEFCKFGGLPVRCTYIPELNHAIQRAAVDTGHAVTQLNKLVRDPALRNNLGAKGRLHVSQYSLENMVDIWDKILTDMMDKPLPINSKTLYTTIV